MPNLTFHIVEIAPLTSAAAPTILARLRLQNEPKDERIQSISLNGQVQLQPLGRPYSAHEEEKLTNLFGDRDQWGRTMKPLLWTNLVVKVPPFAGQTEMDLLLPCSFDLEVAAHKYFYGLNAGTIAVSVLFSGTAFFCDSRGVLQVAQIPWDREVSFQLPVEIWEQTIDAHYPNTAWLRLSRETFDRLYRYRVAHGVPFWNGVIEQLLAEAERHESASELATGGGVR
jgi:hypothetical protein